MARLALKLLAWSLLAVTSVVTSADRTRTDSYWFERELHESEGYLRVKRTDVNPPFKEIERRSNLTLETFLREYARVGKPVVVTDGTKDWDFARASKWTARSLKKAYPKDVHNRRPRIGELEQRSISCARSCSKSAAETFLTGRPSHVHNQGRKFLTTTVA